jgi:hypothetical protein
MPEGDPRASTARRLRWQARACALVGSPLYERLLDRTAADVEAGGPASELLEPHAADPPDSMLGLRLMAGVHRLALAGEAPELARFYPSVGGTTDVERVWRPFAEILSERMGELASLVKRPCQTNEVGRSTVLLGGFLLVVRETGLPLRLLEIGSSAGLNLRFDRYHYTVAGESWGDRSSPVRFDDIVVEGRLPFGQKAAVAERLGCDANPLDPSSEDDRLTLMSAVWPDQPGRVELLRKALALAAAEPLPLLVERAAAGAWLERMLADPHPGIATVVFHSIVWQYLSDEEQALVGDTIMRAGARASAEAPFAWLRMERGGELAEVRLTLWPGGAEQLIARAGYHGRPVHWLA